MTDKAVASVLIYNAFIILIMTGMFVYFENGWPAFMIFLLADWDKTSDD